MLAKEHDMHITTAAQRAEQHTKALDLISSAKSAGRDLSDGEVQQIDELIDAIKSFDRRETVGARAAEIGLTATNATGEFLDLSSKGASVFARQAVVNSGGVKSVLDVTATAALPTTRETGVEGLPAAARTFLSLLETRKRSTRTWTYLEQSVREDAAAIVKPGETKPTSRYGMVSRTGELKPLAHISEPVDKYLLRDATELESFLAGEMARGVFDAIEARVLAGTGSDGEPRGILHSTGVHQTESGADAVTTLRAALAAVETAGYVPGAVVMTPNAWAAIEGHRNTSGAFDSDGPINSTDRKVWGVPVFTSTRLKDTQAIVLDRSAVIVSIDDHGVEIEWDSAGERFARNEFICRAETRVDVEIRKPKGIAVAALPASGQA